MSSRDKLNDAHINVAVVVGGVLGLFADSITVFVLATLVILAVDIFTGELRPFRRPPPRD